MRFEKHDCLAACAADVEDNGHPVDQTVTALCSVPRPRPCACAADVEDKGHTVDQTLTVPRPRGVNLPRHTISGLACSHNGSVYGAIKVSCLSAVSTEKQQCAYYIMYV